MLRRTLSLVRPQALLAVRQRPISTTTRLLRDESKKDEDDDEVDDTPIKYTTSRAADWKAEDTFYPEDDSPAVQGPLVALSVVCFMMYFCIIREENDLDEQLYKPLNETVPNLPPTRM